MPVKRTIASFLLFLVASLLALPVLAATSATFVFDAVSDPGDLPDGPDYIVTAVGPVDDAGGCDVMVMIIVDPTGGILDVDTLCINILTGTGGSDGDYGSFDGTMPAAGPATYALFDINATDIAALVGFGDNDQEYYDYVVANGVLLYEDYFDIPGFVSGTPYSFMGAPAPGGAGVPTGCRLSIPAGSVVGEAPLGAQVYWSPGNVSPGIVLNPGTYIVVGQDESETYYQIFLACQFVWVRKDTMQPSYLPPQNGTPLPTRIVS